MAGRGISATAKDRNRSVALIYPHQLHRNSPVLAAAEIWLVEDPLFFSQFRFHRQKLILHRAAMQVLAEELRGSQRVVRYVRQDELKHTSDIAALLHAEGVVAARVVDPTDDWLLRRLRAGCAAHGVALTLVEDANFLTPISIIESYRGAKKLFFTEFYTLQRRRCGILLDGDKPFGGAWTFDTENRKRLPKGHRAPLAVSLPGDPRVESARREIRKEFPSAPGSDDSFSYAITPEAARRVLSDFIDNRLALFGDFEDAISVSQRILYHSALTPALNCGLLTPREVLDAALARQGSVPLNSLEGFVRQVLGWREYMRLVYLLHGSSMRRQNYLGHTRQISERWYGSGIGIEPIDHTVQAVLDSGYCHHIERLMLLGNIMVLCEVSPDEAYRWFMEMFIDAYDWVMVPNVYGMSQYAAGGLITTKPYISGSNYVRKMSDYPVGPWCDVWDALYWRFIDRHRAWISKNPRLSVMVKAADRLGPRLFKHRSNAEAFLQGL